MIDPKAGLGLDSRAVSRLVRGFCVAVALGASGLAAAGCGAGDGTGGTTTNATTVAKQSGRKGQPRVSLASRCDLGGFLHSLDSLEAELAVGLSYEQYFAAVKRVKDAYESVPVEELELTCLAAVGTPAEKALNRYIEAANVWRECRADVRCGTYAIEPRLQRKWRVASHYIADAHEGGSARGSNSR